MDERMDELQHYGTKGMRWGVRRYQNKDGDLTPAGKKRYITVYQADKNAKKAGEEAAKKSLTESRNKPDSHKLGSGRKAIANAVKARNEAYKDSIAKDKAYNKELRAEKKKDKERNKSLMSEKWNQLSDNQKTAIKVGTVAAGTALAIYGVKKLSDPKVRSAIDNFKFEMERRSVARKYDVFPSKFDWY